jgi:hypothetical protein
LDAFSISQRRENLESSGERVSNSVHFNPPGKRSTATLYVGNLDHNVSEQGYVRLWIKSFMKGFGWRMLQFQE